MASNAPNDNSNSNNSNNSSSSRNGNGNKQRPSDIMKEEIYEKFRATVGDVRPSQNLRKMIRSVFGKLCPTTEVERLFAEFEKLDGQVGREFDLHIFMDWLFDSNPDIFTMANGQVANGQASRAPVNAVAPGVTLGSSSSPGPRTGTGRSVESAPIPLDPLTAALPAGVRNVLANMAKRGSIQKPRTVSGFQLKARTAGSLASKISGTSGHWSAAKWIGSLRKVFEALAQGAPTASSPEGHSLQEIVGQQLIAAILELQPGDQQSELDAVRHLASMKADEQEAVIRDCVRRSMPNIEELLTDGLRKLTTTVVATPKEANRKYSADVAGIFDLSYSSLDFFFGGLESMVGRPDVPIVLTMWREHCRPGTNSESDLFFTAESYGVYSTSRIEFMFVLFGEEGIGKVATEQDVAYCIRELEMFDLKEEVARVTKDAPHLQTAWEVIQGELDVLEGLADELWMAKKKVPAAFSALSAFAVARDTHARQELKRQGKKCTAPGEDPAMLQDPSHARCSFPLKHYRLEFYAMNKLLESIGETPLQAAELIGARLYTGPLSQKYNAVLCMFSGVESMINQWREQCVDNTYTATVHVINSACVKISKVQEAVRVYRGLKHGSLPQPFLEADAFGLKGGIEFGFMTTTTDRRVAIGDGSSGTVFELQQGMMDRGASLEWISQYPHEKEICFGPLSAMQVVGSRVEDALLVVEVRLSVAMRSLTIEQVIAKRRSIIEDICKSLSHEAKQTLKTLQDGWGESKVFFETLSRKVQDSFVCFYSEDGDWYNDNAMFKACTVSAIDLREAVLFLERALTKEGTLFARAQAYRKLISLNMLTTTKKLSEIIDASGKVQLGTELQLDELGVSSSIRTILEDLSKDNQAATKLENMGNSLRPFLETLQRNSVRASDSEASSKLRDDAAQACGAMAAIAKESYLSNYGEAWREVLFPFVDLLQQQLVGYRWEEGQPGPSFEHMRLRLAAVKALLQLLEVDAEVCRLQTGNIELVSNLTAWCIGGQDCRNSAVPADVRTTAIRCLKYSGPLASQKITFKVRSIGEEEVKVVETTASQQLCQVLAERNESDEVLACVGSVLTELGLEVIIEAVDHAGMDLNPEIRASALKLVLSCQKTMDKSSSSEAAQVRLQGYLRGMAAEDPEASLRQRALAALGELGMKAMGPAGVDAIFVGALEDGDVKARETALDIILSWGKSSMKGTEDKAITARISECICKVAEMDSDDKMRRRALEALLDAWTGAGDRGAQLQSGEALTLQIMEFMCGVAEKDASSSLRGRAVDAIRVWIRSTLGTELPACQAKVRSIVLRMLKISAEDPEWKIRQKVIATLAICEIEVVVATEVPKFLARRLAEESDRDVKVTIISALAKYKDLVEHHSATLLARHAEEDSEVQVRAAAFQALADLGAKAVIDTGRASLLLGRVAEDSDSLVRAVVARAFAKLGPEVLGPGWSRLLSERAAEDESGDVRAAIIEAFANLAPEALDPGLVILLKGLAVEDPEWFVRQAAIDTLGHFGPQVIGADTVQFLVERAQLDADEDVRKRTLVVVETFGAEAIGAAGLQSLAGVAQKDKDAEVWRVAERVSPSLEVQAVVRRVGLAGLIKTFSEADTPLAFKTQAMWFLLRESDLKEMEESGLGALLESVEKDGDEGLQVAVHAALCSLGKEAQSHVQWMLQHIRGRNSDWVLQRAVAEALGVLRPEALPQSECEVGGVENVTLACEVMSNSNLESCRQALKGEGDCWYCDSFPSSPWLRLEMPAGMELQRLEMSTDDFGPLSPTRMRILGGSHPHPAAMTQLADVAVDDRKYTVSLLSEANLQSYYDSCGHSNPNDGGDAECRASSLPLRFVHIEIGVGVPGASCKVAGLQVFAAWGSATSARRSGPWRANTPATVVEQVGCN